MDSAFRWIFSGMFALIPGIFFAIGLTGALDDVRKYSNATSTQGVIVAPDEGVTYAPNVTPPPPQPFDPNDPRIRFRYTADGKVHYAHQDAFFLQARGKLPHFSLGDTVTVHYNAKRPGIAWLMADVDSMSYMMMLFVTPFWTIAVAVFLISGPIRPARPATPVGNGWHQLPVQATRSDKLLNAWILVVATSIPGIAIYLHTRIAPPWASIEMGFATAFYALVFCGVLAHLFYRISALRSGREAVVLINAPAAVIGQPLAVRVEHDLRRAIPEATLEVGLHCRRDEKTSGGGKTSYSTDTSHDSWQLSRDVSGLAMGQPAVCEGELEFPPDARPSRAPDDKSYPRYTWTVQVRTRLPGADYKAKFPIQVMAATISGRAMMPQVEHAAASAATLSPDQAHEQGLEHETHRIVADAPDEYHASEAYDAEQDATDAAEHNREIASDNAYDIEPDDQSRR